MRHFRRWPAALLAAALVALSNASAAADEPDYTDVNAYILQAEMALQRTDYLKAAQEYRKAAELSDNPDIARQATVTGMTFGFNDEALRSAKRWFEVSKKSDEARAYLAQLSFRAGDTKTARRHFTHLLKKSEDEPGERLLLLVRYLSDEDDKAGADKLVRALAKPYPDSARAQYAVAQMALQSGDYEHALERTRQAIELDGNDLKAKLLHARALLASGDVDKAIEYTALIVGDDMDPDPDARMELAIMYMMADRADDALSQVNQVLLEQPSRTDALRLMAIINFHKGQLDAAWDDFHDLLATGSFRMDALYYLARIADYRDETDRAIRFYGEVRRGANALPSQQRAAALLAHKNDNLNAALDLLDDFARTSPAHAVDVVRVKAGLLASLDEHDEALKLYDKAREYRPDDERVVLSRAELLLRMDRLDESLEEYKAAVKRWPDSAMALNAYGYTLADRTDRYREAEKLIRKALKKDPESAAIIDSMGWVLFKLGEYEAALVELERAYERMQDHEVAAHIIETLVALERRDEALERLVAAEELTPDSDLLAAVRERLFGDAE